MLFKFLSIVSSYTSASLCGQKAHHGAKPVLTWHWGGPKSVWATSALSESPIFSSRDSTHQEADLCAALLLHNTVFAEILGPSKVRTWDFDQDRRGGVNRHTKQN